MKISLTCILSLFFLAANAQLSEPILGQPYSTAKKENFSGFLGENSIAVFTADYLYANRKKQELILRKFHKSDLQLIDSKNIYENVLEEFYGEPFEIFYQSGVFYLFSYYYGDKEKYNLLTLETFNEQFEKKEFEILDTLDLEETVKITESAEESGFVVVKYSKFSTLTEQELHITKLDAVGDKQYSQLVKSPLALQNLNVKDIKYGKNTPVYVLCDYSFEQKNATLVDENPLINNKYAIWAYDHKKNYLKEFEIRLRNKWINGIDMAINNDGELILSGFINETRNPAVNGTFSLKIKQMKVIHSSYHKFEDTVLAKFLDEKSLKKIKELPDYKLNNLSVMENGSWFLTGEQYYKYIERSYDPRTNITTTTEHYNYNSIIVSYFDSLGNHIWTDCVPKFQNSTNDFGYYASFSVLNTGKDIYLFFNDSEKNNDLALDDYFEYKGLFNNRRFQISYVKLNSKGVQKRGMLVDESNNFMLRAKVCKQITRNAMYLMGESGRQARLFSVGISE